MVIEPHVPSFDEAKAQVVEVAKQKAMAEALAARGQALRDAAAAGLAAGKTFAQAVADAGAQAVAVEPFTGLSGSSSTNEAVQALVQAVVSYNQGEVADPVPVGESLIVAYLKVRTPADPSTFDSYQTEIASAIRARRGQGLFRDWQAALLAPERFTDLQQAPAETDDLEEDGDEDAGDKAPAGISPEDQQYL